MIRSLLLVSVLILISSKLHAQNIHWSTAPKTGFVFQISNSEAQKLLTRSKPDTIINSLLHTQIDTFNVEKGWTNRPDKGHFILVRIIENKLHCEYTSVFPYQVLLLKEYNALALQVLDHEGNVREDAKVKFKARRIRLDNDTKTYRIENDWFNGLTKIVTVEVDDFRSVFNIEKHEVPSWDNNYYYNHDEGPDFYSYLITDKNKYKPGERVRFKSYALSGGKNPIRKDLDVVLMKAGKPVRLGKVSAHRPGSFAGEFYLHDSLKLTLDQHYTLQLWDKNSRVVANCSFKYEAYELQGNKLYLAFATTKQFHPASNYLKILATTENGLPLKDARATVTVLTESMREVFEPVVILPDTLLSQQLELDGNDTTFVEIPSALFKKSNTTYYVKVDVLNSQNQRMEHGLHALHGFSQYELKASFAQDTLIYELLNNGQRMHHVPMALYRDDAKEVTGIFLPHKEKINAATRNIRLQSDLVSRTFRMADMLPDVKIEGGIHKDSFNISAFNPQQVQFSWFIYQGSLLLQKGAGTEMEYTSLIEDRSQTYYAELLYSFGGSDHVITREFRFNESSLDITLNLPDRVYPGQKVDALIDVTDEAGNPVSGVDLTAVATTAKLNYHLPTLPYYGATSGARPDKATYSKKAVDKRTAILDLDYDKWEKRAGLDTMTYYQFIYPKNKIFRHQAAVEDSTQFSPFVMKNGMAQRVYIVEADRDPLYYSWTEQPKGYSFYVEAEDYKTITLRLHDRVLIFQGLCFEEGKKTIFSVDLDHLPEGVKVEHFKPELVKVNRRRKYSKWAFTSTEVTRLSEYIAAFRRTQYNSYLTLYDRFVPISRGERPGSTILVGPVHTGRQTYTEHQRFSTTYRHTGAFSYAFEDNLVYKLEAPKLVPDQLVAAPFQPMTLINDVFINKKLFLQHPPIDPTRWHPILIDLVDYACRLKILLPDEHEKSGVASVLFQDPKTKHVESPCRFYSSTSDYARIARGLRNVIVLYNNGTYLKQDSVQLQSYTNIAVDMNAQPLHAADSSSRMWLIAMNKCYNSTSVPPRSFALRVLDHGLGNVRGTIHDPMNSPIPGVNIVVRGTTIGTGSDANGDFSLDIPSDPAMLVISFIGFKTVEIEVQPGSDINVILEEDVTQLSEVVVVGYGSSEKREMTGSLMIRGMSSLHGRVAGLTIAEGDEEDPTPSQKSSEKQNREAEQKLYQELLTLQTIRSQFSDVGFWEPKLFTDRHGKSKFTITFPDDITRWDAVVYGMNSRLQTGTARKSIRSYKPLMAELHVPQFLTMGDSADFIGKVLNYTSDKTIAGKTTWTSKTTSEKELTFNSYHTEKLTVVAADADTLTTRYAFTRSDGYFDGEERKVPVIAQGALVAKGTLSILNNNEQLTITGKKGGITKVHIVDNQLDLYTEDVRYLLNYRYACNEQLASKLIGLLNYKLLMRYEGKTFRHDKDVNKIIQRLLRNQNSEFLWSWWDVSSNTSYWMSAHILRALKAAKDAGYTVNLDIDNVVRKATYKYEFLKYIDVGDVQVIHALAEWNAPIDYKHFVARLDRSVQRYDSISRAQRKYYGYTNYSMLNDKLLLMEIRQLQNLPFVADSLLRYKKQTILNEIYFSDGNTSRYWYSSTLPSNAIAYRIVKRDSTLRHMTTAMQMYFLSLRKKGGWNTYESSNVLMSILPDLLSLGTTRKNPATLSLTGKKNERVQNFPFSAELSEGETLHITKESGLPLYCTQYIEERVTKAHADTDAFTIKTSFDDKKLKAGKPFTLSTTIEVKREAKLEHVMIEIPIPAGCSYADKSQSPTHANVWYRDAVAIETHREYFKDHTSIFCENMKAGTYVFQVQLLPRFTGRYFLNPAQVSLMYFPVVNANTAMEKVKIVE